MAATYFGRDKIWPQPTLAATHWPRTKKKKGNKKTETNRGKHREKRNKHNTVKTSKEKQVGLGPEGWARKAQDFALFSPAANFVFLISTRVLSWNCGRGSRTWTTKIARWRFHGVILCEPRRPQRPLGFPEGYGRVNSRNY